MQEQLRTTAEDIDALELVQSNYRRAPDKIKARGPFENEQFVWGQSFPDPSHESTGIRFSVAESGRTPVIRYDLSERKIKELFNDNLVPETYTIYVKVSDLDAGIRLYKMQFGGQQKTLTMIVTK